MEKTGKVFCEEIGVVGGGGILFKRDDEEELDPHDFVRDLRGGVEDVEMFRKFLSFI